MPGYKEIADVIAGKIARGEMADGSPILSLHTLCREFNVSYMTAVRTHAELHRRNLVVRIHGLHTAVIGPMLKPEKPRGPKLEKIVLVHRVYIHPDFQKDAFSSYFNSVVQLKHFAQVHQLEFEEQFDRELTLSEVGKLMRSVSPETAYIISFPPLRTGKLSLSSMLLLSPKAHVAVCDSIVPQAYCIVNNFESGMEALTAHIHSIGVRSVLYLQGCFALGNYNAAARYYGCLEACARRNISFTEIQDGFFPEVLKKLRSKEAPDAVMCPQDTVADHLRQYLLDHGVREEQWPVITGCDGVSFAPRKWKGLSIAFESAKQAKAAAKLLLERPVDPAIFDVVKVPGKLIIPK